MAQIDRNTLIFFVVMFLFLMMPSGTDSPQLSRDREALEAFHQQLSTARDLLHNSQYNTGYGNVTGFHLSYDDAIARCNASLWPFRDYSDGSWREDQHDSILPNVVSERVSLSWANDPVPFSDKTSPAYLLNVSGKVYGSWSRLDTKQDLVPIPLAPPTIIQQYYSQYAKDQLELSQPQDEDPFLNPIIQEPSPLKQGNFSRFKSGKISLSIDAHDYNYKLHKPESEMKAVQDAVIVKVAITLSDDAETTTNTIDTTGVYFQELGALIAVSGLAKFLGSAGLSHLTLDARRFLTAKLLLEQYLNSSSIDRDVGMADLLSYAQAAYSQCEFVSFFQLKKTDLSRLQLRVIDEELAAPQGRPLPRELPSVLVSAFTIYLPDCAIVYTSSESQPPLTGSMALVFRKHLRNVLACFACLLGAQLWAFMRQFHCARSPTLLMSILKTSLFLLGYQDSIVALSFLLLLTITENMYLVLAAIAAIAFVMVGVFETRFMVQVMQAQQSERGSSWWQILRGPRQEMADPPPTAATNLTDTTNTSNMTGNTATTATTNTAAEPSRWGDENSNSVFGVGFSLTIISTFIALGASLWSPRNRRLLEFVWILATYLFWLPQFLRNTLKNRRQLLSLEFVIVSSIVRAIPILYLLLSEGNPFRHHRDVALASALAAWLLLQIILLLAQKHYGPRFWVRENWLPQAYDYHQVLNAQDLEKAGFALELLSRAHIDDDARAKGVVICANTCPICMVDVELPVRLGENDQTPIDTSAYMITPCYHAFHRECLESWIQYKLQCPVCRERLPPV